MWTIVLGFMGLWIGLILLEQLAESLSVIATQILVWSAVIAVAVASYRRSRCLSGYPIWRSVLISIVASAFVIFWLIAWWVNRERIADEWAQWRAEPSMHRARHE